MSQTGEVLLRRLESKGLSREKVSHFIRCTMSLLHFIPENRIDELNDWLHVVGWADIDLDYTTLQMMEQMLEDEDRDRSRYVQFFFAA
jgi:hypothetical protein